ncbi:sirohydrochlorin chelatase [Bacillus sp. FJAT-27251]|uniref:sirohydrochlorin chelatase n=1 Tax=Bacillus sp. FJAT-27251 TaxID=1684142 RepID=UPI0006A78C5B|nr:sirohydrochlorin chelatase [Bacillus sp. FJAT-27251]
MDAVLYVCHGSRVPKAREQAVEFIKQCMRKNPAPIQEYCFLELAQPTIEEGFAACVERGAERIAVIPVLLLTAAHAKEDIPDELRKVSVKYPEVEVRYGRPIGVHKAMVEILLEKLRKTNREADADSLVLLVGRGSSDPDSKRDLNLIAGQLEQRLKGARVRTCFLTAARPKLPEALDMAQQSAANKVFIMPYLLFTGILMKTIEQAIKQYETVEKEYILCDYLGYHNNIEGILRERAEEALQSENARFR